MCLDYRHFHYWVDVSCLCHYHLKAPPSDFTCYLCKHFCQVFSKLHENKCIFHCFMGYFSMFSSVKFWVQKCKGVKMTNIGFTELIQWIKFWSQTCSIQPGVGEYFPYHEYRYAWQCRELARRVHKEEFGACCCSVSATPNWKSIPSMCSKFFFSFQGLTLWGPQMLVSEFLKSWGRISFLLAHTNAKTRGNIKCHRLLSSQRFCKWSPNSSKSPSSSLRP